MADQSELMKDLFEKAFGDGAELTDDFMENVVGGLISPEGQAKLLGAMSSFKNSGVTLDTALANLPSLYSMLSSSPAYKKYFVGTNLEEVTQFVTDNWASA